jgi:hypothetical protein
LHENPKPELRYAPALTEPASSADFAGVVFEEEWDVELLDDEVEVCPAAMPEDKTASAATGTQRNV